MTERSQVRNRSAVDLSTVIPWTNDAGAEIPAYGVVQLRTNYDTTSHASKPNDTAGLFFVNGPVPVAATKRGESLTWNRPRTVMLAAGPLVGDEVGPTTGSWEMSADGTGFRVLKQASGGTGVVVQVGGGSGGSAQFAFGILHQDSGQDDSLLSVTLYQTADLSEFTAETCGGSGSCSGSGSGSGSDNSFLNMDLTLCTELGSQMVLVPAGYKAGNVGVAKWPICGAGSGSGSGSGLSDWNGWVVMFGIRARCVAEIPSKIECCPLTSTIKITEYSRIWYFGGELSSCVDPCPTGSGSGSGSGVEIGVLY